MSNKKEVIREFTALSLDYKAEVLAAEIMATHPDDIEIGFKNVSTFDRPLSKDVEALVWDEEDERLEKLMFLVNRESLYDMIPQNLTHYNPGKSHKDQESFIADIKFQRQQEAFARKFFQPIEGEFYHQRMRLETLEREFNSRKNAERNRELFKALFGDSSIFEDMQVLTLLYLLPLAYKIRGDAALISFCLTRILGYDIVVTARWAADSVSAGFPLPLLEDMKLGLDTILAGGSGMMQLHYYLDINRIPSRNYHLFMNKGNNAAILQFLIPFFFPAGNPVIMNLNVERAGQDWILDDESTPSYFGYNTFI